MTGEVFNTSIEPNYPEHVNAGTIDQVISLMKEYGDGANLIAGGTDLVRALKNKVIAPELIVNLKTVPGLKYINEDGEGLKIGALTTLKEIIESRVIRGKYPILAEAAYSVASPHIRNMGTIVGNLCQDVQCWYYRRPPILGRTFYCKRKGGKECHALKGENVYHAIFGSGKCFAACPSDMAPALIVLGATIKIRGPGEEKMVTLEGFHTPMGTNLKSDEMITTVCIPPNRPGSKQRFLKFRDRKTIDFAMASVAVALTLGNGAVENARIVLGGVAPVPYRAFEAEETIKGEKITEGLAEAAARTLVDKAKPLKDNAYKVPLTQALVKRAILMAS